MLRRILHIDMDAFFASVEMVCDPALRGKALIVGGTRSDLRGVVSTASYEARKYGVHSAMPIAEAVRLCPHGIYMRGNHQLYGEISREIRGILETVSPQVQMASIDEAYVDVTGSQALFGGDDGIANYIKTEIRNKTELPSTIAIAPNKLVAKIASDEGKPDGYVRVANGDEAAYLAPLPVRKLPGAGPRACETLDRLGIETLGQLAQADARILERHFGAQTATHLQRASRGESDSPVVSGQDPKSISRETTFAEDLADWTQMETILAELLSKCCYTLRQKELEARRLTLKVRYRGFDTKTWARTLDTSTNLDRDFHTVLAELLPKAKNNRERVRLVGVGLSMLSRGQHQMGLFDRERDEKWERTLDSLDALRGRHGFDAVKFGRTLR